MEQISRAEKDWLLKNKYLAIKKGKIPDLICTRRKYYVPPDKYQYLKNK